MSNIIYTNNYKRNLILYWQQYYPNWNIPKGYHIHHIKPKSLFESDDILAHHPSNLIALHPDDHVSIHEHRGDKFISSAKKWIIQGNSKYEKRKQNIDENGLNDFQRAAKKASKTRRNTLDKNGKKISHVAAMKASQTMQNTVLNGKTTHELRINKGIETKRKQGKCKQRAEMAAKTMNVKCSDGQSIRHKAEEKRQKTLGDRNSKVRTEICRKGVITKLNDIDENGLSQFQRQGKERSEKYDKEMKETYPLLWNKNFISTLTIENSILAYVFFNVYPDLNFRTVRTILRKKLKFNETLIMSNTNRDIKNILNRLKE